ncbi:MAG: hypothetical protein AB8B86_08560 [Pseudomonadales bacterium]
MQWRKDTKRWVLVVKNAGIVAKLAMPTSSQLVSMNALLQNIARHFGLEMIPAWQLDDLALARHLRALFERHNVQQLIEVGTNSGAYGQFLRREVKYLDSILSYEANAEAFKRLSERATADPKWQCVLCEISPESEGPESEGRKTDTAYNALDSMADVTLPLAEGAGRMLKLDTQHLDFHVLDGATKVLNTLSCLQLEIALPHSGNRASIIADSVGTLDRKGFILSGMFPVESDDRLCANSFDCVFLNTASVG